MSFGALVQKMIALHEERPSIVTRYPRPAADGVIVDSIEQARFSALLSDALAALSIDVHAADDRAILPQLQRTDAEVLVKIHGSLRRAGKVSGYSYTTIWRALKEKETV